MGRDVREAVEAVWRIESARLIASLARMVRDVGLAEDLAQDAFATALEKWPDAGIPDQPGAWLMATARRRAIDRIRHVRMAEARHGAIGLELDRQGQEAFEAFEAGLDHPGGDDRLGLMFATCHPMLPAEGRTALTLKLLGGLATTEIARAFLVPEATVAQRIVRAKRTLREARVPIEVPPPAELEARLASVLEVIYLIFNEGYVATSGSDWARPGLCEDALRLGRILAHLMPAEAEVHGLLALLEIQASRLRTRMDAEGNPVLLLDQDRSRWDHLLVRRGLASLARAESLAAPSGPYTLQAGIAACHARARSREDTDWTRMVALYDALAGIMPSPVVELNRAVALAMMYGPAAGLAAMARVDAWPGMTRYHLVPSTRGTMLFSLGRFSEARAEFERAAALTDNERERALLLERAAACVPRG